MTAFDVWVVMVCSQPVAFEGVSSLQEIEGI